MKSLLRSHWLQVRQAIPEERRLEASRALINVLKDILSGNKLILSYASFKDELDTTFINEKLAKENRLVLPRIDGFNLSLFQVENLDTQLEKRLQYFREPDPSLCKAIPTSEIKLALVPGIAFDAANHRLGYGKGYYDRFLEKHGNGMTTIGIGFLEQFSETLFPVEEHDIHLSRIILV